MDLDNITIDQLKISLNIDQNQAQIAKAGESAGKSGSFFFKSFNDKLIVKTISHEELKVLIMILDDYKKHIKESQNMSLICRIYGAYTLKTSHFAPIYFILMQNTVKCYNFSNKLTFDLKGSTA
jgi:1-phosphatidylinositol-4-phosphate 5-kinase